MRSPFSRMKRRIETKTWEISTAILFARPERNTPARAMIPCSVKT